jgi:cytochrome c biogenesis protein CcdA/thiol-disulfide isomerase/thioredoxin
MVGLCWLIRRLALCCALMLPGWPAASADPAPGQAVMLVFWAEGCPHCHDQKPFLTALAQAHPSLSIEQFELSGSRRHHALLRDLAEAHGIRDGSVPTVFLGGRAWIGDSPAIRTEVAAAVAACMQTGCEDPRTRLTEPTPARMPSAAQSSSATLTLPMLGEFDLAVQPLLLATFLIAFVDGFNPCSLWVLTLLLALVVQARSRARVVLVGVTFLVTTALVYGAFIVGVFGALAYVLYYDWVRVVVALLALAFALINIKDYFWFRRGLSLTIADEHKPWIYRRMRALRDVRLSLPAVLLATVAMALGIALVELPCTAGFPVLWGSLVAAQSPGPGEFAGLLAVYLGVYLSLELVVFAVAVVTLRMGRFGERHGQLLKLVGGAVMLALAAVILLAPGLLNDLQGVLLVFLAAVTGSLLVDVVVRRRDRASPDRPDRR